MEWIVRFIVVMDTGINIILLHLQFVFMNKCYKLLCNPFRLELNNIINKHLNNSIQLTVIDTEPTINTSTTKHTNDISSIDIQIEMDISGLAPTHTSQKGKTNNLQPTSQSISSINYQQNIDIYLCCLCPISM